MLRKFLPSGLKGKIRKALLGFDFETYYFSQAGEDYILKSLMNRKLKSKQTGFFIDVGAYDPVRHSNTYFFYRRGWQGINIDPRPGCGAMFNKVRPRDINLEFGVSDKAAELTYYYIGPRSTMNSFSKSSLENSGQLQKVKKEISVKVERLDTILNDYQDQFDHIDFLSIDVEGLDMEVLRSNDWNKYKPSVVVIELEVVSLEDVKHNESAKFLMELGYVPVAKNIVTKPIASVFFVSEDFVY